MNPSVEGYAAAVLEAVPPADRSRVADDLLAVARQLARNAELLAIMTDSALPPAARRAVLADVLEGKVSAAARRAAAFATGAVRAQEVAGAVSSVAHRAHLIAEGGPLELEALGHRQSRDRIGGFAAAVFEDLSTAEIEEVEDELFRFARTVADASALRAALGDRDFPVATRQGIVADLLEGKARPATLRLVQYVVAAGRPRDVAGTLDWLVERAAEARGWRVARVRAGQEVDRDERRRLEDTLTRLAGSPVELQVTVEPDLLAGVNVEIGDLRVDATARGRLERLREHVLTGGWQDSDRPERGAVRQDVDGAGAGHSEGAD